VRSIVGHGKRHIGCDSVEQDCPDQRQYPH
jgi:hypothetical protein